jgi:hypothetical protein
VLTVGAIPLDGEDSLLSRRNCIDFNRKIVGIAAYLLTYLLTYYLRTARIRVLEKLTGSQLVKKFPSFDGTRKCDYSILQFPPPVPVLGHTQPLHAPKPLIEDPF